MTIDLLTRNYFNQEYLESNLEANLKREFRRCHLSVMDTIADPNIHFDEKGICNYYYEYKEAESKYVLSGDEGRRKVEELTSYIKQQGAGKEYDCILGLSGGVDSTYLCWFAKELGLRPLIVHCDNGWNSELAVSNIENVINKLGFDLFTYVIDWAEFRELQLSYLKASVVDIEVLTDHAFMAVLYEQARKFNIKYVLAGMNVVTEQVLPKYWIFSKGDAVNIKDIQAKFGNTPVNDLKSYPFFNYRTKKYCDKILKMEIVAPLNYIEYNYDKIKELIKKELGWREYGGKHYESVWTRFYQGYILPKKFNIDKRKAHLSNLIFSGQLSKEEALTILESPTYDPNLLHQDMEFVLKKLGLSPEEFEALIAAPRREHTEFNVLKGWKEKYPILKLVGKVINNRRFSGIK